MALQRCCQESVECPICLEELDEPRLLSCSHAICLKDAMMLAGQGQVIICPLDRTTTWVPHGDVKKLPTDRVRATLREALHESVQQNPRILCDHDLADPNHLTASCFCQSCCLYLCPPCWDAVHNTKDLRRHQSLYIGEARTKTTRRSPPSHPAGPCSPPPQPFCPPRQVCFDPSSVSRPGELTVSANGKAATRTSTDGQSFTSVFVMGETSLVGPSQWRFRIKRSVCCTVIFGVVPAEAQPCDPASALLKIPRAYGFYCRNGSKVMYDSLGRWLCEDYGARCLEGDEVEMIVDPTMRTLTFRRNGQAIGVDFFGVQGSYRPCVSMLAMEDVVEILEP